MVNKPIMTVLVLLSVVASGCGLLSDADEKFIFGTTRQPEELEYQYRALANELHSIKPCYLIHPQSVRREAFSAVGSQVSLVRSSCFDAVADSSGNESYCDQVRSASTLFLSGANLNAEICRRVARTGGGISLHLDVPGIVSLAGYDVDYIDTYLVSEGRFSSTAVARQYRQERSGTYWNEVRTTLLHSEDFFVRIAQLPGFAASADLAKMQALVWEPRRQRLWIPPEQRQRTMPGVEVSAPGNN